MAVSRPKPSDKILKALKDGLGPFLGAHEPLRKILTGEDTHSGELEALPIYAVGFDDVLHANWQAGRRYAGWRFFAVDADKHGIVVDVVESPGPRPPRVGGVQRNPHVGKTIKAVRDVQPPNGLGPNDVELSFLTVPGLQTEMFWIKPKNGAEEGWLLPFRTLEEKFESQPRYLLDQFFSIAKDVAGQIAQDEDGL